MFDMDNLRQDAAVRGGYSNYRNKTCPCCEADDTEGYIDGEYIDIGVGMQQVSSDCCQRCHYYNPGYHFDEDRHLDVGQYRKLWELQIDPDTKYATAPEGEGRP